MQAIIIAYPRFAKEHGDLIEQTLRCCIIQSLNADDNSYVVRFERLAGSGVWNGVHYDYHIVQKEIGAPPQPPNSQPIAKFQPSASLLGSDVMAFMAGYAVWTDYQKKKKLDLGGTAAQAVSIHQFAYFDHLVYGIGFTHKWYVTNTLGCDYNVRIEPETYKQSGEISVIC
ncbi:MAG: hypothetical protein M3126_03450 [Candidatus Eremiobacteraeota bacterium]|nr:hypothetical protein [Candidatus Eremiobacteraeota bacterium]